MGRKKVAHWPDRIGMKPFALILESMSFRRSLRPSPRSQSAYRSPMKRKGDSCRLEKGEGFFKPGGIETDPIDLFLGKDLGRVSGRIKIGALPKIHLPQISDQVGREEVPHDRRIHFLLYPVQRNPGEGSSFFGADVRKTKEGLIFRQAPQFLERLKMPGRRKIEAPDILLIGLSHQGQDLPETRGRRGSYREDDPRQFLSFKNDRWKPHCLHSIIF